MSDNPTTVLAPCCEPGCTVPRHPECENFRCGVCCDKHCGAGCDRALVVDDPPASHCIAVDEPATLGRGECLNCGMCEDCIQRSIDAAEEYGNPIA